MKSNLYFRIMLAALIINVSEKSNAQSPEWLWAEALTGNVGLSSIAIDPAGNEDVYIAGNFSGKVDFNLGPDTFNLTSEDYDLYISKSDNSGNFLWVKSIGGTGFVGSQMTVVDPGSGDVYITGNFVGNVDFDPGPDTFNLNSPFSPSFYTVGSIFISKLDAAGNFKWAKRIGVGGYTTVTEVTSIAVDPSGNGDVYTTGNFYGTVDFDPGPDTFNLNAGDVKSMFISKLDGSGNFVWAKALIGDVNSNSLALDPANGDVYTTGWFKYTIDFDPGSDTFRITTGASSTMFISKLNKAGDFIWAISEPGDYYNMGQSIAIDPIGSGDIYIAGDFGEGGEDVDFFISKFDSSGKFKWTKETEGTGSNYVRSLVVDPAGNKGVYAVGQFNRKVDVDPGPEVFNLISDDVEDKMFILKLDGSGNFVWAKAVNGNNGFGPYPLALDHSGHLYTSGSFRAPTISFGSTTLFNSDESGQTPDIFIAKLNSTSFPHGQIFVKQNATGNNDGTSWQNAFTKFQDALDQADNGDQLWIAAGTYIPEGPSADSSHFLLKKGVEIYGGFNGSESTLSERKLWMDTTTLSGDILGNDLPSDSSTDRSDNAHHILILDCGGNETIIDGLVFKGGSTLLWDYDNDSTDIPGYNRGYGGALYIRNTPAKIRNCLFWDNYGFSGSCLYSRGDSSNSNSLLIANSTFLQNRGTFGAGIFLDFKNSGDGLHYVIDSCTFDSNISFGGGCGVIYSTSKQILQSTGAIRNSEFLYNHEGAVFSYGEMLLIENCKFKGNYQLYDYPKWAGGLWGFGSAIYFENYHGNITVRNTKFIDNDNDGYGGTVSIEGGVDALFENVLFYRNFGYHSLASNGNIKLINSTWVDNEVGLALWFGLDDHAEIQNCVFDNEGDNLSAESWSAVSEIISKGGNISSDTTLASFLKGYNSYADLHQTNPLLGSDFVPLPGSPSIDAGNPEGVLAPYDLAGNPRVHGNGIDAGAYESPFIVAVKDAVWDSQVFSVFPNPVKDIINFELESDWIGNIRLHVYNNQGQPVYKSEMNKSGRIQTFRENLNLLPPGEYVVLAIAGKTTYASKVIFL